MQCNSFIHSLRHDSRSKCRARPCPRPRNDSDCRGAIQSPPPLGLLLESDCILHQSRGIEEMARSNAASVHVRLCETKPNRLTRWSPPTSSRCPCCALRPALLPWRPPARLYIYAHATVVPFLCSPSHHCPPLGHCGMQAAASLVCSSGTITAHLSIATSVASP